MARFTHVNSGRALKSAAITLSFPTPDGPTNMIIRPVIGPDPDALKSRFHTHALFESMDVQSCLHSENKAFCS
jgi:hypothetical protein